MTTPDCAKSYRLAERSAVIVSQLIRLSSLALLRPVVRRVLELTAELGDARPEAEPTT